MAAKQSGHNLKEIQAAKTRSQFQTLAQRVISTQKNEQGQLVETYLIEAARGSATRALMHGMLDLASFGAWEVIGTPVEGCLGSSEHFVVKVTYNDKELAERVELP